MNSQIPTDLNTLLTDLDFASNLPANHHLNSKNRTYDQKNLFNAVLRWFVNKDDRWNALDFLNSLVDRAIVCGKQYPAWTDTLAERVCKMDLTAQHLINFYNERSDPNICSSLRTFRLRTDIQKFIGAIKEKTILLGKTQEQHIPNSDLLRNKIVYSTPAGSLQTCDLDNFTGIVDAGSHEKFE